MDPLTLLYGPLDSQRTGPELQLAPTAASGLEGLAAYFADPCRIQEEGVGEDKIVRKEEPHYTCFLWVLSCISIGLSRLTQASPFKSRY